MFIFAIAACLRAERFLLHFWRTGFHLRAVAGVSQLQQAAALITGPHYDTSRRRHAFFDRAAIAFSAA